MGEHIESETTTPPDFRSSSPDPSIIPTPAISSCPSPDRTFSSVSSVSNFSANSGDGKSSVSNSSRRRGYIRTTGAEFAESARHRESVMSLGSIAHLQYYFARTGLLDGKGAQMARPKKKKEETTENGVPKLLLTPETQDRDDTVESPMDELPDGMDGIDIDDVIMLPPTVSTYSVKTHHIPPPPDLAALRKDLLEALDKAEHGIETMDNEAPPPPFPPKPKRENLSPDYQPESEDDGLPPEWHDTEGVRILDVVTLAIRAARIYYISHERPDRLASIKSEKTIREELLAVLDVLKRWASRNFVLGLRDEERAAILGWMSGVRWMLDEERKLEDLEAKERENWHWADGDWTGREREREEAFLRSLENLEASLPTWTSPDEGSLPTPMLERLRDGRELVRMHNQAVRKSKRPFGQIKVFHDDVAKPYRRADNLRYWMKAAEIRWEIKLEMDVMGVVYGSSDEAWKKFDRALLAWCKGVREELARDWRQEPASLTTIPSETEV
ncbi:hypothetical protein VTN00DRAFT_4703 [Thermoascus crustaceus]|uniref:uncharacterized protein n=1 Tax=Thermoascus crustaceus TaxID=5088 RepID=UPI003743D1DF